MKAYDRHFSLRQSAKLASVIGLASGPLLLAALRKGPLTAYDFATRSVELFKDLAITDPLPTVAICDLGISGEYPKDIWIDLGRPSPSMPPNELALLCALVKWKNPKTVVEVGTYRGFTTLHVSRNTSATCRIFTADLPPEIAVAKAAISSDPQLIKESAVTGRVFGPDQKITEIFQDSTTIDWASVASPAVDFAFVDGSHLYEHVRRDTEALLKVLAPDGILLWHDYLRVEVRRGVGRYLSELRRTGLPLYRIQGTTLAIYINHA